MGVFALGLSLAAAADEAAEATTYTVEMTGVTWGGCESYVRGAFKKLDGVIASDLKKDIKISAGDKPGTQKVVLKSTKELTKEQLTTAMGSKKERFVVQDVKKG